MSYSCIILAGGEGKRVGNQDKGLLEFKRAPLIQHVIDSVCNQVDDIVISANRNLDTYKGFGYPVVSDNSDGYMGPMSGIASCLQHCKHDRVLVVACDMPHLPDDLVERLSSGMNESDISIAETEGRMQLAFMIDKGSTDSLKQSVEYGELKLMRWIDKHEPHTVSFSDAEPFRNFNHLDELAC